MLKPMGRDLVLEGGHDQPPQSGKGPVEGGSVGEATLDLKNQAEAVRDGTGGERRSPQRFKECPSFGSGGVKDPSGRGPMA
jgi:hypothetical protein